MISRFFHKLFGSATERMVKKMRPLVAEINSLEPNIKALSDDELRLKTDEFRQRLEKGETLDQILPEAFAVVREASIRTLGMRHFDVQLIGGIVLHRGMISEMRTGEGKTLVATLPVYLNAIEGKGVHVVTVNDYLALRDSEWMGKIYRFLGLTVGCIQHGQSDHERQQVYGCDVTYGTNNEYGFDYLRDNMKFEREAMVQRPFNYAIVDEVDSILIDEARTPLIISGPAEDSSDLYRAMNQVIPMLSPSDYEKDEKSRAVTFTEDGTLRIETILRENGLLSEGNLYDIQNISLVHHANQALKAHIVFVRDVDYIVKDDKVIIIDEFTGRMMEGRRFSEGLHQALEAKEGVTIEMENQTLASITFQNYFRLYPKLSGMTGTAGTEAPEFADIYNLEVVDIPTNKPVTRKDYDDEVYRTAEEKYDAILKLIEECRARNQPVLVGTVSIEKSEVLSSFLKQKNITHSVLNARYHDQEAHIIAQAGSPGAITIATNMAGRGTDIKLGGNIEMLLDLELNGVTDEQEVAKITARLEEQVAANEKIVLEAGGLYVIGTERHESRRIDNQLRGRSGRQGDPGASKFFLSLQDDLMRIFASERLDSMLQRLGLQQGEAITHPMVTRALEKAQQKVEARNYDMRKHLLRYDDVMNDQRKVIYELRKELMDGVGVQEMIEGMRLDVLDLMIHRFVPAGSYAENWEIKSLHEECLRLFALDLPIEVWASEDGIADVELKQRILHKIEKSIEEKEVKYPPEILRMAEKSLLLRILDNVWKDHLLSLDHLRQGINLRAYAQRNPLDEYKSEAFNMFESMLVTLRETVVQVLSYMTLSMDADADDIRRSTIGEESEADWEFEHSDVPEDEMLPGGVPDHIPHQSLQDLGFSQEEIDSMRRNDPCLCGSGRRYKHCHGQE